MFDVITLKRKRKLAALAFSFLVLFPFLQVLLLTVPSTVFAAEYIVDTDHGGANWTLANGDVIAGNHTNILTFTIPLGATVSVKDYNGSSYGSVTVSATTIDIEGTLTANGSGYSGGAAGAAGSGSGGGGVCAGSSGGAGGGYGGAGGSASGATGGSTYGSSTEPTDLGSGGGGSCGSGSTSGGDGGGAIKLTATGTITVDGTVESNGDDGSSDTYGGGAGSGGSIHFVAATLAGTGSVLAEGGDGGSGTSEGGAGGGGGRISLQYTSSDTLSGSGTISVAAGSPGSPGAGSIDGQETRTTALDVMTRQKISASSDHSISFGIPEGVDAASDTIIITFASGFNLSSITISDVDFEGGGIDKTLAASPAAGVWGYSRSVNTITFTAPTDAGANEITAGGAVDIEIGTVAAGGSNQIVNPSTVGTYAITIGGTFGAAQSIYIPIVDDDRVTVTASIETYIHFDIDIDDTAGATGSTPHDTDDDDPYDIELGDLLFTSVTTENSYASVAIESNDDDHDNDGVEEIYFDLSTNSTGGAVIDIYAAADTLASASSGDTIPSFNGTLLTSTEDGGWGLACAEQYDAPETGSLDTHADFAAPFNGAATAVEPVPDGVWDNIFDTNSAAIQFGDGVCYVRAVSGTSTHAADDYTRTLYFRATVTF